ncbi:uncharacterized protein LOC144430728 [Styela clava]
MEVSTNTSEIEVEGLVLKGASLAIWLSSVCSSLGFFVATSYVMVMLIIDLCRNEVGPSSTSESVGEKMGRWIKISRLVLVAVCNIFYLTSWLGHVLVDLYGPEFCHAYVVWKILIKSGAPIFTYLTVWLRHRIIHSIPAMQHVTNGATRVLSIIVLVLVIVVPSLNRLLIVLNCVTNVTHIGCDIVELRIPIQIPLMLFGVFSIVMHVMILRLFLHPLRQHQRNIGRAADNLTPLLQRAFFTTLVCCVSDIAASVLIVAGLFVTDIAMQTTIFINIWMILISFPEWKTTLFPFICFTSEVN